MDEGYKGHWLYWGMGESCMGKAFDNLEEVMGFIFKQFVYNNLLLIVL